MNRERSGHYDRDASGLNPGLDALFTALILIAVLLAVVCVGCEHRTVADLRPTERQANWVGRNEEGSCGWASLVSLLIINDDPRADIVVTECGGGSPLSWSEGRIIKSALIEELDRLGIEHIETARGDEAFLYRACDEGPGCVATVNGGTHAVAVVAIDPQTVTYLGPNHRALYRVRRDEFLADWRRSGGCAICPLPDGRPW